MMFADCHFLSANLITVPSEQLALPTNQMPCLVAVTHLNEPSLSLLQADFMGLSGNVDGGLFNNMYKDRSV